MQRLCLCILFVNRDVARRDAELGAELGGIKERKSRVDNLEKHLYEVQSEAGGLSVSGVLLSDWK